MKKTFSLWLLAAGLVAGFATAGYAQNRKTTPYIINTPATADQIGPKPTVLAAGCLRRGPGAYHYALHGPRLQQWELTSNSVDLEVFLDEEVRVAVVKPPENDGTLIVTDLVVLSVSCVSQ